MAIDVFMIGTGFFGVTTAIATGAAMAAREYRDILLAQRAEMLQRNLELSSIIVNRNAKIAEFEAAEKKRQDQRKRASLIAAEKRHQQAIKRHAEEDPARRAKTIEALSSAPLRSRDAVVAPVREKRALAAAK